MTVETIVAQHMSDRIRDSDGKATGVGETTGSPFRGMTYLIRKGQNDTLYTTQSPTSGQNFISDRLWTLCAPGSDIFPEPQKTLSHFLYSSPLHGTYRERKHGSAAKVAQARRLEMLHWMAKVESLVVDHKGADDPPLAKQLRYSSSSPHSPQSIYQPFRDL